MKQTWDKLNKEGGDFQLALQEIFDTLPTSPKFIKLQNNLKNKWRKFTVTFDLMDEYVQPMTKSIPVESPLFNDAEFKATWKMWKDYLVEQHAVHMRSRAELMGLKRLGKMTNNNPTRATYILEHAMSTISKSFYEPNEPIPEEKSDKKTNGTGMSLPQQYLPKQKTNGKTMKIHQTTLQEQIEKAESNTK